MADYHRLAPLLFKRLKENEARACVPTDAWERLRLAYFASADRNRRFYLQLRPLLAGLRTAGIPVIVLKGAYLAEAVYGDVALRPMGDVDLMVRSADLPRAQAILLDMADVHEQPQDIESLRRKTHHLPRALIRGLTIEIHWAVASPTGPFRVDAAGLWDRARPATTAGVEVLALSPEDLLVHLCLHFSRQHGLAWLRLLCDTAETILRFRGEMDWMRVTDRAGEWGASRYVGLTLHLARSMLGTEVPGDVLERLVPGGPGKRILETARECLLAETDYLRSGSLVDRWGAMPIGGKAKLSSERVFLSREEMAVRYPASRETKHFWFYYVLRLRDVTRTLVADVLRRGVPTARSGIEGRNAALANWLESEEP
jgi:hypothetical protein